jgi:hypothetical protein
MCSPDRPCVTLDFDELRTFALAVTHNPAWRGRQVSVGLERRDGWHGSCWGRVIRFAAQAPACIVVHELAHVRSHTLDHGPAFWQAYQQVDSLAQAVWRSRLAHRGAPRSPTA